MSMAKFGSYADVTRQSVNNWEKGKSVPDWFSLENLKKNIYLNPEWVMLGKGEMFIRKDILELIELTKSEHFEVDSALDYLKYLALKKQSENG